MCDKEWLESVLEKSSGVRFKRALNARNFELFLNDN